MFRAAFLGGVALLLASASSAAARDVPANRSASEPTGSVVAPGYDDRHIQIKFLDDLDIGIGPSQYPVDRSGAALQSTAALELMEKIAAAGGVWKRMAGSDEARMDLLRARAVQSLGRRVADMNTWFVLTVPLGLGAADLVDAFRRLSDVQFASALPLPMPAPLPDNYLGYQAYLSRAPDGIDTYYAWTRPGGTGTNVTIVDLEYSWNLSHADLPAIATWIPPGMTAYDPFDDPNHGTAVLGEMASLNNGWGATGAAHGATFRVAPTYLDLSLAIATQVTYVSGAGRLVPGDIILIEQQAAGPNYTGESQFGLVPVEWDKATYDAIVTAVGNGIHVVEAAGNGSQNLDDPVYSSDNGNHWPFLRANDSGAIIVGAGAAPQEFLGSDTDRSRLDFSNYGSRLDLQGWGENVVTTGYGGLYDGEGPNLLYTWEFSGTSSASPIVASAVALLESVHEAETGSIMSPADARNQLRATGAPQQAGIHPTSESIGPRPNLRAALGGVTAVIGGSPGASSTWVTMDAPWPNPAASGVNIRFHVARDGLVRTDVYDVGGRRVSSPVDGRYLPAGQHLVTWDGTDMAGRRVPAGIYGIRVSVGSTMAPVRRIVIID